MNQRRGNLDGSDDKTLTNFDDDLVVQPSLSRYGNSIVYRGLFDLYRPDLAKPEATPEKLEIRQSADAIVSAVERRALASATVAALMDDGLEMPFVAGEDVRAMDTELCEPRRVTATPEEQRMAVPAPDDKSLVFVSERAGRSTCGKPKGGRCESLVGEPEIHAGAHHQQRQIRERPTIFASGRQAGLSQGPGPGLDRRGRPLRTEKTDGKLERPGIRLGSGRQLDRLRPFGRRIQLGYLDPADRRVETAREPFAAPG